jgi:hypothetical protein
LFKSIPSVDWTLDLSPFLAVPVGVVVDRLLSSQQRSHIEETSAQVSEERVQSQQLATESNNNEGEEWPETSDYFQAFSADTFHDPPFEDERFEGTFPPRENVRSSRRHPEWLSMEDEMAKVLDKMRNQYVSTKNAGEVSWSVITQLITCVIEVT